MGFKKLTNPCVVQSEYDGRELMFVLDDDNNPYLLITEMISRKMHGNKSKNERNCQGCKSKNARVFLLGREGILFRCEVCGDCSQAFIEQISVKIHLEDDVIALFKRKWNLAEESINGNSEHIEHDIP
uniref:Uncharacterized protein n=1 Tax=viral metagenome TaxID=1070528 RepID=A0A6M3JNI8_9ZZZZ